MNRSSYWFYLLRKTKRYMLFELRIIKRQIKTFFSKSTDLPETIQLPITHKCNFNCVMCGMQKISHNKDFSSEELGYILDDRLFQNIKHIGVNGGEPFIRKDIIDCFKVIIKKCKNLKAIDIISNGFFTDITVNTLREISSDCQKRNISLNLAISIDGIYDMQDFHRGKAGSFSNAVKTLQKVKESNTVNNLSCICTITRFNINRINELEDWMNANDINISYNLATFNERIKNEDKIEDFSVFSDEHSRMLASEFFYKKFLNTFEERYYGLFLFLETKKRYSDCPCQYNKWVTLTPDGEISYCATHSKKLGNALNESAYDIFNNNIDYLNSIKNTYCEHCSHYMYNLNVEGLKIMKRNCMRDWFVRG